MAEPHERLDAALDARRIDLDLSWKDLAATARTSEPTLRAFRSGARRPTGLTQRRLEDALGWESGSIDAVLDGGQPTPAETEARPQEEIVADIDDELAAAEELFRQGMELLERARQREQRRDAG